jgi:hypothetical protein
MAKTLYTVDITKANTTHYIQTVLLTDEQQVEVAAFLAEVQAKSIGGVTAASITAGTTPTDFAGLALGLKEHVPLGKHSLAVSHPSGKKL